MNSCHGNHGRAYKTPIIRDRYQNTLLDSHAMANLVRRCTIHPIKYALRFVVLRLHYDCQRIHDVVANTLQESVGVRLRSVGV